MRAIVFLAVLLMMNATLVQGQDSETLRVGAILALSGDFAVFGTSCQNAIKLAQEELAPEMQDKLEIIVEDDALTRHKAVDAFQKLSRAKSIGTVITFTSESSNAIAPLAESMRLPMLAIGASDPRIVKDRKFVYSLWVSPKTEARVVFDEVKRRGYKRIARASGIQEGALAIKKEFDALNKGHIDIVLDEEFTPDTRDFKTYAAKLKNYSKLDAIFSILMPGQNGIFTKQVRQLGVRQPFFNVETFEDPEDVKASDGAMLGAWYAQIDDYSSDFTKKFMERYPDSSLWSVGACYDAVYMLADAVKKRVPVEKYLYELKDFKGVAGTFSSTKDGHFTLPAAIKVVTENGFEKLR